MSVASGASRASWIVGWLTLAAVAGSCGDGEGQRFPWQRDDTTAGADADAGAETTGADVRADVAPWVDPSKLVEPGPYTGSMTDAVPGGLPGRATCPPDFEVCGGSAYCCPSASTCFSGPACPSPWCCVDQAGLASCGGAYCPLGMTCTANPGGAAMCGMELCCTPEPEEPCPGDLAGECPEGTTCLLNHSARACTGIRFACYHPEGLIACPREVLCPSTVDFCPEGTTCTGLTDGICPAQSRGNGSYCCRPGSPAEDLRATFEGPFGSATSNVGCGFAVSLAGQVALSLVTAADGSLSGTGTVQVTVTTVVTYAPSATDCSGGSFDTTATGDLAGADGEVSGSFSDGSEPRPLTATFSGTRVDGVLTGTLSVAKLMHSTSTAGDEDFAMSATFPGLTFAAP